MHTRIESKAYLDSGLTVHIGSYAIERKKLSNHAVYALNEETQAKILYIIAGNGQIDNFRSFQAIYLPPGKKYTLQNIEAQALDFITIKRTDAEEKNFNCSIDEPSLLVRYYTEDRPAFLNGGIYIKNKLHSELPPEQLPITISDTLLEPHQKSDWIKNAERSHHFLLQGKCEVKLSKNQKFHLNANKYFTTDPQEQWKIKNRSNQPLNFLTIFESCPY